MKLFSFFLLATVPAFASTPDARLELTLGLSAHIDGKDSAAVEHFGKCLKLADPKSSDANSCRIYEDMFGAGKVKGDGASKPEARKAYRAAVVAYKKGDLAAADKGWHECLELSVVATAVRNDCLAAIDLIPRKRLAPEELAARNVYMEGVIFYMDGLTDKAARAWRRCQEMAPPVSDTQSDCAAGLRLLKAP